MMGAIAGEKMNFIERLYNTYIYSVVSYYYVQNANYFQEPVRESLADLPPVRVGIIY